MSRKEFIQRCIKFIPNKTMIDITLTLNGESYKQYRCSAINNEKVILFAERTKKSNDVFVSFSLFEKRKKSKYIILFKEFHLLMDDLDECKVDTFIKQYDENVETKIE